MKKTTLIALTLCAVFLVTASSGFAQVINGCVKNNGQLRIVSSAGQCGSNETAISWNAVGPQGPQGPQGPPGVTAGISAAVYGTVTLIANGQITPAAPATFSVTHTPGTGAYNITFTPNPFTPTNNTIQGANAPTCIAASRYNPLSTICVANTAYDTSVSPYPWSAIVNCSDLSGFPMDADFQFVCVQ